LWFRLAVTEASYHPEFERPFFEALPENDGCVPNRLGDSGIGKDGLYVIICKIG
jgi:hypothetical protein